MGSLEIKIEDRMERLGMESSEAVQKEINRELTRGEEKLTNKQKQTKKAFQPLKSPSMNFCRAHPAWFCEIFNTSDIQLEVQSAFIIFSMVKHLYVELVS